MGPHLTVVPGGARARDARMRHRGAATTAAYDFRKPESLPKAQIRQLHGLFESFLRAFDTKVSAYLRFGLTSRVVSVEQEVYSEFLAALPRPTCLFSLGLKPYPANAIMELSPALVFPVLEILLGAKAGGQAKVGREVTEIERNVLDEILHIILGELRETWKQFTPTEFGLESSDSNLHSLPVLLASEPVVAFTAEVHIGEEVGLLNLAIPSIAIKMMKSKFDQQNTGREPTESVPLPERTLDVLKQAHVTVEARLSRAGILIRDLLELKQGQVIGFAHAVSRPLDGVINGQPVYKGEVVAVGARVAFQIQEEDSSGE